MPNINLRLQPDLLTALDALITDATDPRPTRPEAIRQALTEHLRSKGYLQ